MERGYVKFPRYIFAGEEWQNKKEFTSFEAQAFLLQAAVFAPTEVEVTKGVLVTLQRGQLLTSVRKLAKRWGWEQTKVHRFLHTLLEGKYGRLRVTMTLAGKGLDAIITILDYDVLMDDATPNATPNAIRCATPNTHIINDINSSNATPNATPNATRCATHIEEYKESIINTHTHKDYKEGVVGGENCQSEAAKLFAYVCEHYPELQQMSIPLTLTNAEWILRRCSIDSAKGVFDQMANKRVWERNSSVYSTFTTFAKYDPDIIRETKSQKIYTYREMCDYISVEGKSASERFTRLGKDRWILKISGYAGSANN